MPETSLLVFFPVLLVTWGIPTPTAAGKVLDALLQIAARATRDGLQYIYLVEDCMASDGIPSKELRQTMAGHIGTLDAQYPEVGRVSYLITGNPQLRMIAILARTLGSPEPDLTPCASHLEALRLLEERLQKDGVPFPDGLRDELLSRHNG